MTENTSTDTDRPLIENVEKLDALPEYSRVVDVHDDVWEYRGGLWQTPETKAFGSEWVFRKWSPLHLVRSGPALHAEHLKVDAYDHDCIEGECAHEDPSGAGDVFTNCPVIPVVVCVDCMDETGAGRDEENWDGVPLSPWPHPGSAGWTETPPPERRTKRRYAHELYPHAGDGETRPLAVDVPYLLAQAIGYEVAGTSWFTVAGRISVERTMALIRQRELALIAVALHKGMAGDEAWQWASERTNEESSEWIWEYAQEHDIPWDDIKPYACGPEPDHHLHLGDPFPGGGRYSTRVQGPESECPDCTEPIPTALAASTDGSEK